MQQTGYGNMGFLKGLMSTVPKPELQAIVIYLHVTLL